MPMQIAQDKRNVYQFLKYIVREDSQINFVTRYVPWIFSETLNLLLIPALRIDQSDSSDCKNW